MATIYQNSFGDSVYDLNGQTIDAKTGKIYVPPTGSTYVPTPSAPTAPVAPTIFPSSSNTSFGAVNTTPTATQVTPTTAVPMSGNYVPTPAPTTAPTSSTSLNLAPVPQSQAVQGSLYAPAGYTLPASGSYVKINGNPYKVMGDVLVPASATGAYPYEYVNAPDIATFAPGYVAPATTTPTTQTDEPAQTGAPTQTGTPVVPTGSQSQPNDITQLLALPDLQPGSQGQEVLTLQNWLVAHGFLSGADQQTGPGTYGPKTTAAVAAWQAASGIDTAGNPGYFGPKSKAYLQEQLQSGAQTAAPGTTGAPGGGMPGDTGTPDTTIEEPGADSAMEISDLTELTNEIRKLYGLPEANSGMTITQQAIQDYQNIYTALGIPTVKQAYEDAVKEFSDIQNELDDKIAAINEDPWLSEGTRVSRVGKMRDRYETKLNTATGKMNLYKSLVDQGQAEARDIMSRINQTETNTEQAVNKAISIVEKQIDAAESLQLERLKQSERDGKPIEVSPGATLYDPITGKPIYTAPTTKSQNGGTDSGTTTLSVSQKGKLADLLNQVPSYKSKVEAVRDLEVHRSAIVAELGESGYNEILKEINRYFSSPASTGIQSSPTQQSNIDFGAINIVDDITKTLFR